MSRFVILLLCLALACWGCWKGQSGVGPGDTGTSGGGSDTGGDTPVKPGAADPPYTRSVRYPSGLMLTGLVRDAQLTGTYPNQAGSAFPFDAGKVRHYTPVGYFIDIAKLSGSTRTQKVTENFVLNEYVSIPERNRDMKVYVDAQIAYHVQELRSAHGGPLVLSSTFRSPEYNDRIGGATFSRHQYGDALDVATSSTAMAQNLYNLAKFLDVSYLEPADLTIVGRQNPWIHIDDRGWPVNTPSTR